MCVCVCVCVCVCIQHIYMLCCTMLSCSVMPDSLRLHGLQLARLLCPWNSLGNNTGVGSHSLLYGIFPTQGLNPGTSHCRQILHHLSHQGICTHIYNIQDSCLNFKFSFHAFFSFLTWFQVKAAQLINIPYQFQCVEFSFLGDFCSVTDRCMQR